MVLIGAITWVRGVLLFITQIIGGIVAAYIVQALFQGKLAVSTTLGGGTTVAQGVVIEMILTAQLVFTIFMLAAEKHTGNFIAPVGIGLSLFVAELTGRSHDPPPKFNSRFPFRKGHSENQKTDRLIRNVGLIMYRSVLDRRLSEPCSLLRPCSCSPLFPFDPMDLLGRAYSWLSSCCAPVQADQITRI